MWTNIVYICSDKIHIINNVKIIHKNSKNVTYYVFLRKLIKLALIVIKFTYKNIRISPATSNLHVTLVRNIKMQKKEKKKQWRKQQILLYFKSALMNAQRDVRSHKNFFYILTRYYVMWFQSILYMCYHWWLVVYIPLSVVSKLYIEFFVS